MILIGQGTHKTTYTFSAKRKYSLIADRFVRNTTKALDYLNDQKALILNPFPNTSVQPIDILKRLTENPNFELKIVYAEGRNYYKPHKNTIGFYDTHGIVFRIAYDAPWDHINKGYNSPSLTLAHECIHAYHRLFDSNGYRNRKKDTATGNRLLTADGKDLSYPNAEEVLVVNLINDVAQRLKEDKRHNYGRTYYKIVDVRYTQSDEEGIMI